MIQFNLRQMGLDVDLKPQPFAVAIKMAGTRGSDFDMFLIAWFADYPDPFDFINVLLDGQNIQAANNSNYAYFNSPKYNAAMTAASRLNRAGSVRRVRQARRRPDERTRPRRAPLANGNVREFISGPGHELPVPPGLRRGDHERPRHQVAATTTKHARRGPCRGPLLVPWCCFARLAR